MFENEFANIAYNVYNGRRVHVIGRKALHEIREDFGFNGTAVVHRRNYNGFGGIHYLIYIVPDCDDNDDWDPYKSPAPLSLYVETKDDLDNVAKRITLL